MTISVQLPCDQVVILSNTGLRLVVAWQPCEVSAALKA